MKTLVSLIGSAGIIIGAAMVCFLSSDGSVLAEELRIGSSRQLFLDDEWLLDSLDNVQIRVHRPVRKEIIDIRNRPWEGSGSKFHIVLFDPQTKRYQMYYTAWAAENIRPFSVHNMNVAYLESLDGIRWNYRPLRIQEWEGSLENNLILKGAISFAPCIDPRPNVPAEQRYKGITDRGNGAIAWFSSDGIHWTVQNDNKPVYTTQTPNAFDSQTVVFWSEKERQFVLYYRARDPGNYRSAERAVSKDFIHWTNEGMIQLREDERPRANRGEYYTNQVQPYYRAPEFYIGFPARYNDNGITESFQKLPEQEERAIRMKSNPRFGTVTSDSIYIVSHDGIHFRTSNDVFLAPGLRTKNNWGYGDNYLAAGVVETQSPNDDEGRELSLYATESAFTAYDLICRRYSLRIDGFASLHAATKPGTVVTLPICFEGKELSLNVATSGFGTLQVEICRPDGTPLPGFTKSDCDVIYGDSLDYRVSWKGSRDVSALSNQPIVLKFYLQETDIYSLKFE